MEVHRPWGAVRQTHRLEQILPAFVLVLGVCLSHRAEAADEIDQATLERGMLHAVERIPELDEAFRLAEKEGVELSLYGGTTRSLGFYVKRELEKKGATFFQETSTIPLEDVVGPYSDLDLIVRGDSQVAGRIGAALRTAFPEGERFYRWELQTEQFLQQPWQIVQGYEPVSKILFGNRGFEEFEWRRQILGTSLTEQGVGEILSGTISYVRNPRYRESQLYQRGEHHELLEVMRYVRFLHEFEGVQGTEASIQAARAILEDVKGSREIQQLLQNHTFKNRLEMNLRKLQYSAVDNVSLGRRMEDIGLADVIRTLGYESHLRVPLPDGTDSAERSGSRLGRPLVLYHGTKGFKEAWSIYRGGFFMTTHSQPHGVYAAEDPWVAKQYSNGEDEFILRIEVDPNARIGEDLVQKEGWRGEWVLKSRQAIEGIAKPLTTLQVKADLLRTLARRGAEEVDATVRDHLRELEARAEQGSFEALSALAGTRLPREFDNLRSKALNRLLHPDAINERNLRLFVEHAPMANFPPAVFQTLMRRTLAHQGAPPWVILHNWAQNPTLGQLPDSLVRQFLESATKLKDPLSRNNVLTELARNPSFLREDLGLPSRLLRAIDTVRRSDLRGIMLHSYATNPSLGQLSPRTQQRLVQAMREIRASDSRRYALEGLAENPALSQFSEKALQKFWNATSRLGSSEAKLRIMKTLARNPALDQFPSAFVQKLVTSIPQLLIQGPRNAVQMKTLPVSPSAPQSRALAAALWKNLTRGGAPLGQLPAVPEHRTTIGRGRRIQHELRSFGKGMGIWMGALALSDAARSVASGKWRDIPGQIASMVHPESLASLGVNYGSFSAAARAVEQPMLWMASKGSAQALRSVARFAGPLGFFAGSAVADWVTSGHLDLERWLVSGAGFLGSHALLNATVAPLIITGLGLSSTGIGATVGVPILILAGSMLGAAAIEHGYYWLKDYLKRRASLRHQHDVTVDPSGSTDRTSAPEPQSPGGAQGGGGIGGALDRAERAMR